jgi:hypothetical protein
MLICKVIQAGAIQRANPVRSEEQAVGDQSRDGAAHADAADDGVEIGVQRRLAPAERDYGGAQIGQTIDPSQHCFKRNGRGSLVVFVAVGAIQVAAPDRHDLRQNRVRCRLHGAHEHARLADLSVKLSDQLHEEGCSPLASSL